jgi:two-component system NarL family response regulator
MTHEQKKVRVLVAEDNPLTRFGTVRLIDAQPDMTTIAEAEDGEQAIARFRELRPDVVVMDLRMPKLDGVAATKALREQDPTAKVLVLSYYDGEQDVVAALRAGALGYVTKGVRLGDLVEAIRQVARGEQCLPPEISARLASGLTGPQLSDRERQVLELVFDGMSNREIGQTLGVTERTAIMHVSSILEKLGARSRTEAVSLALARGLLTAR